MDQTSLNALTSYIQYTYLPWSHYGSCSCSITADVAFVMTLFQLNKAQEQGAEKVIALT